MNRSLMMLLITTAASTAFAGPLDETRYCGAPVRDSAGQIYRSSVVRTAFQHIHPCPVNGSRTGACEGWQVDHVIPLACGGCDHVSNMQWLPVGLKTAPGVGKDRFERRIYGGKVEGTPSCSAPKPK